MTTRRLPFPLYANISIAAMAGATRFDEAYFRAVETFADASADYAPMAAVLSLPDAFIALRA